MAETRCHVGWPSIWAGAEFLAAHLRNISYASPSTRLAFHTFFAPLQVLSTPRKRRGHVLVDVLAPDGRMGMYTVTQRKLWPSDYRYVRKLEAGSTVPMVLLNEPSARWGADKKGGETEYYDFD